MEKEVCAGLSNAMMSLWDMLRSAKQNVLMILMSLAYMLVISNLMGGGYGSAILFKILQEAFDNLHAHKVICEVLVFNDRAICLYEKFGMQKQGYFKEYLKRDNERIDCVSYAIFNEEWQKLRNDLYERICNR
jgi:hypothetical protein